MAARSRTNLSEPRLRAIDPNLRLERSPGHLGDADEIHLLEPHETPPNCPPNIDRRDYRNRLLSFVRVETVRCTTTHGKRVQVLLNAPGYLVGQLALCD